MKWADLKALQYLQQAPLSTESLHVESNTDPLEHAPVHVSSQVFRKKKSSEPLQEACAAQAPFPVHVTAFDNTTLDSGQQFFVVTTKTKSTGLRCGKEQAHRQCTLAVYTHLFAKTSTPTGNQNLSKVAADDDGDDVVSIPVSV